jgi:hypothetical protein
MMEAYIRLTNLAFFFLLDEVQLIFCKETEIQSRTNIRIHHTLLTLILTEFAVDLEKNEFKTKEMNMRFYDSI